MTHARTAVRVKHRTTRGSSESAARCRLRIAKIRLNKSTCENVHRLLLTQTEAGKPKHLSMKERRDGARAAAGWSTVRHGRRGASGSATPRGAPENVMPSERSRAQTALLSFIEMSPKAKPLEARADERLPGAGEGDVRAHLLRGAGFFWGGDELWRWSQPTMNTLKAAESHTLNR